MLNKTLQKKILFTLGVLILYRIGTFISIPTVDIDKLSFFLNASKSGILSVFNTFSGGAISRASVFSLGIMPYISSSIIIQLAVATNPSWKSMKKDNPSLMQRKINIYTRYLAVLVSFIQAFGVVTYITKNNLLISNSKDVIFLSVMSLCCGTFILIWLSDRLTIKGITNGTSVIIFGGIISEVPKDFINIFTMFNSGLITAFDIFIIFSIFILLSFLIILIERSNRLIHIQYPHQSQLMNRRDMQSLPNFMPLKVNPAGIIPPIFSNSLMSFFLILISFLQNYNNSIINFISKNFSHGTILFIVIEIILIVSFSFFYNNISTNPKEISEQLRRAGVFVPGIRPGESTVKLFEKIIMRLSLIGGLYLSVLTSISELSFIKFGNLFFLSGISILIINNVVTDIILAIQTNSLPNKYQKINKRYR